MYTFTHILLRNIILALLFIASISAVSLTMLSTLLEKRTTQQAQAINIYTEQLKTTDNELLDAKNIADKLLQTANYHSLTIYNNSGETLFSFNDNNTSIIPFVLPEVKSLPITKLQLRLNYQLDFIDESILVATFIILSGLLSLFLMFFAASMSAKRHKTVLKMMSEQIKNELASIKNTNNTTQIENSEPDDTKDNTKLEIPELKKEITDIKFLIKEQFKNNANLEQEAYIDNLTKLENRGRFVQFYESQVIQDSPVKFGVLVLTRCSELQTINQIHGYKEGDNYILHVSELMKRAISSYPDANLFRLNSSDFACILPNIKLKDAENFTTNLTALFNEYQQKSSLDSVAYSGLVSFDKSKPLGELLAMADTGVSISQTQGSNAWYSQKDTDNLQKNSANYGNQNWRQEIENVLENKRIKLLLQAVQPNGRNSKVYHEVLARFLNSNDEMLPTASFIAMSEKLDKIIAVDKLIIEVVIKEIMHKNMFDQSFGINISARSISDEHFMIWLERKLLRDSKVAPQLVFEITEYGLQQNIKTSKRLIDMLHRVGARVTVERFGVGLTSFKFFKDLTPDYIKMDSSYTRDIDNDKNNQYFLRLMVDLAHRLGVNVLAESVESQEEKHTLEKLFIDGCQGFYIGKPEPL